MAASAYCDVPDLLIGNVPLPDYVDPAKFVQDAADEIDSQIGFRYATPVDVSDTSSVERPVKLLLKRLNAHLASGRLLLNLDAAGEDKQLHAYGVSLIKNAMDALGHIASGQQDLPTVPVSETAVVSPGPQIANVDSESNVEAFYDRIANPYVIYQPPFAPYPVTYTGERVIL